MDFRHPFISKPKLAVYYILFWITLALGNILIKWLAYNVSPAVAVLETISLPFMFAIVGSAIWYVIKFSTLENNSILRILLSHVIAATIIVLIWLYLGAVIIKLLHPDSVEWLNRNLPANIFGGYFFISFM